MKKQDNIVLMGFMGVGKGRLARLLSIELGRMAIDTDDLISSCANKSPRKIFAEDGEKEFRKWEQKIVDWVIENVSGSIISAGGGMPIYAKRFDEMGTIVYLKADFDWIYQRLKESPNADRKFKKRPLFQDVDRARKLLAERMPIYESQADLVLDVMSKDENQLVKAISSL